MVGNLVQAWGFMSGRYFVPPCLLTMFVNDKVWDIYKSLMNITKWPKL